MSNEKNGTTYEVVDTLGNFDAEGIMPCDFKVVVGSNEVKFTAGPWIICDKEKRHANVAANAQEPIAMVYLWPKSADSESAANLNLIAAAPEMYEALRALSTGEGLQPGTTIESILLKARGEK